MNEKEQIWEGAEDRTSRTMSWLAAAHAKALKERDELLEREKELLSGYNAVSLEAESLIKQRDELQKQFERVEQTLFGLAEEHAKVLTERDELLAALKRTTNALREARTFVLLDDKGKAIYDETGEAQADARLVIAKAEATPATRERSDAGRGSAE
jgi:hypothetical protein